MRRGNRLFKDLLWVLVFWGAIAGIFRLWFGLGATTHLTDDVPWGLWKVLNMVAGVALSTSGFAVGFLVYVLRLERFRPLLQPAILVAFLGYACSCTALLFDIGQPQRFWHPLVMWNGHSFLFEVFWCVMLYLTVTAVELLPMFLERLRARRVASWLHRIAFGVVITGISLSSLHHSSLGSLFLVSPQRLHPLWYSAWLPLFFFLSAAGAGLMVIVLLRILYARIYDPEPIFGAELPGGQGLCCSSDPPGPEPQANRAPGRDFASVRQLATIAAWVLGTTLLFRLADLLRTGAWRELLAGTWESWLYGLELGVGALVPVAILLGPARRRSPAAVAWAAAAGALGLVLNRLNVGIFGYLRSAESYYFPSAIEWALGLGVIAGAALAFFAVAERFPIFDAQWRRRRIAHGEFQGSFDSLSHVWNTILDDGLQRVTSISVLAIPLAIVALYPPFSRAELSRVHITASTALDPERSVLRIDGDRGHLYTLFPHAEHQDRLRDAPGCVVCHHVALPEDHSTPCSRCHLDMTRPTAIFDHLAHMDWVGEAEDLPGWHPGNGSCAFCHAAGLPESGASACSCLECHEQDIWSASAAPSGADLARAPGFLQAMHGTCIPCHREAEQGTPRQGLSDCATCHPSLVPSVSIDCKPRVAPGAQSPEGTPVCTQSETGHRASSPSRKTAGPRSGMGPRRGPNFTSSFRVGSSHPAWPSAMPTWKSRSPLPPGGTSPPTKFSRS